MPKYNTVDAVNDLKAANGLGYILGIFIIAIMFVFITLLTLGALIYKPNHAKEILKDWWEATQPMVGELIIFGIVIYIFNPLKFIGSN